jgi:hypothetical protein
LQFFVMEAINWVRFLRLQCNQFKSAAESFASDLDLISAGHRLFVAENWCRYVLLEGTIVLVSFNEIFESTSSKEN